MKFELNEIELYRLTPRLIDLGLKNGIKESTQRARIHSGWTPFQAVTIPLRQHRRTINLVQYKELAKKNGIPFTVFQNRLYNMKWTPYDAATVPMREFKNIISKELKEKLKENKIPANTFRARVKHLGWSEEKASTTPINTQFRSKNYTEGD